MYNEKWYKKLIKLLILPVAVYLLFFIISRLMGRPTPFGTGASLETLLMTACSTIVLAWGASYNLRSMRFDFSLGALQILAVVLGTNMGQMVYAHTPADSPLGSITLLAASAVFGLLLGLVVGAVYVLTKVSPIIVGLAMALIYEGIATWLANGVLPYIGVFGTGASIANDVQSLGLLGSQPWIYIMTALAFVFFFIVNHYSVFSYHVNALAMGQKVGAKMGIHEKKNVLMCYAIGGLAAGFAGALKLMVEASRMPQLSLATINTLTNALGPVFIGMFLAKYCEITVSTLVAGFTFACLNTGLANLMMPAYLQSIATIAFLMVFLGLSMNAERRNINKALRRRGVFAQKKLDAILAQTAGQSSTTQ